MHQNLLNSREIGNPNSWKHFYLLLGRTDDLLPLSSLSPWKIKKKKTQTTMTTSHMALLYSCSEYTLGVSRESVLHFLWIPGHPHRITLITFLKAYQNKLLNFTIHAVLLISLLGHTSLDVLKLYTHLLHTSSRSSETFTCWTEIHYDILLFLTRAWV